MRFKESSVLVAYSYCRFAMSLGASSRYVFPLKLALLFVGCSHRMRVCC